MKKFFLFLLLMLLIVICVVVYNTINFKPNPTIVDKVAEVEVPVDAVSHMAEAISIRTVSFEDEADFDSIQFQKFNDFLSITYPLLYERTQHTIFSGYSHLFKLSGTDESVKPVIIMGHHDVVPIASPTIWSVHPFTEGVKNDTIYGRGCIDDKGPVISILESIEQLLGEGFQPKRTIYFAFGHDEEVSGPRGAVEIVKYLKKEGVTAEFILDEGGVITNGLVPGVSEGTAMVGIAEKGYVTYELTVNMVGGHSSQPARETSIDVMATAISKLKKNPFQEKMTPVIESFMDELGPYMDLRSRVVFSNRWLFESLLLRQFAKSKQRSASVRTTTSPTIFEAGIKENVIPTAARAVVNFRIIPGETVATVKEHIIATIDDDRIAVDIKGKGFDPSPISPIDGEAFKIISKSINQIYPKVVIVPNLVIGATDSRHYVDLSSNIYRFAPFHLTPDNVNCFHGVDERISVEEFENAIRFYRQLILNSSN